MLLANDYYGKKWLLDILAHFLWLKTNHFTLAHIRLALELYADILEEMKNTHYCYTENGTCNPSLFDEFDAECRQVAELFYLEERFKKLDALVAQRNSEL